MHVKIIPLSRFRRWIGGLLPLKLFLRVRHGCDESLSLLVSACDADEISPPLVMNVLAGEDGVTSLYVPPEALSLRITADKPFEASLQLTYPFLIRRALTLPRLQFSYFTALKAHWRRVDSIGGKLWVGRVLTLRQNRINWAKRHIGRLRTFSLQSQGPEVSIVPFVEDRIALASAVRAAEGDFIVLLHEKDHLLPDALPLIRQGLSRNPNSVMAYTDHALTNTAGHIVDISLKPSWNRLFQRDADYIGRAVALRREQLVIALETSSAESIDHRTIIERVAAWVPLSMVSHIAKICFLCSIDVEGGRPPAFPPVEGSPLVSAVIPTRNGYDLLKKAIDALDQSDYPAIEIIIIDHGSTDPETLDYLAGFALRPSCQVIRDDGEFNFSRLMNRGFAAARGQFLLSLNNDVEMIKPDWLGEMVMVGSLPFVGAVGARLLYPDGTIQHAGFMPDSVNDHWYRFAPADWGGFGDILKARHLTLAVTGAVMLLTREAWEKAGPFNVADFPVAFNDIDLCLKIREAGFDIAYTPYACLVHKESVTRGFDVTPEKKARNLREFRAFRRRWGRKMESDQLLSPYAIKQMWPMLGKRF